MRNDESLPCTTGTVEDDELSALNQAPLAFLANCGVRHGGWFGQSFVQAQLLLDSYGTSRRIDRDHAVKLCAAMRQWAAETTS